MDIEKVKRVLTKFEKVKRVIKRLKLKKAIKKILSNKPSQQIVRDFAYEKYVEKYVDTRGTWFEGCKVVNKNIIQVNYGQKKNGAVRSDHFLVKLKG